VGIALAVVSAALAAAAFAATRPEGGGFGLGGNLPVAVAPSAGADPHGSGTPQGEERLPRARFLESPEPTSTVAEPQFRFHVVPRSQPVAPAPAGPAGESQPARRFQCTLDDSAWKVCSSPYRLSGLVLGIHSLGVRALSRSGRPGSAVSYSWRQAEDRPPAAQQQLEPQRQLEPRPFSIAARDEGIADLYPGHPAQQLPIAILNPNPVPIEVTGLTAAIASDPPDCPAENFAVAPASASPAEPVLVPAEGSADLPSPSASAPAISMLNLPVNQDSCRGVEVRLDYSGEARG
jgi:hypothetical protein